MNIFNENLSEDEFIKLLKEESFKRLKEKLGGVSDDEKINLSKDYFDEICVCLSQNGKLTSNAISALSESFNKAITYDAEQYLYKIMYERDRLKKQISSQKDQIKSLMMLNCKVLEEYICSSNFENKEDLSKVLKDKLLDDLEMLGILKETTESAFLTTIEMGNDVEDTIKEIAKNIVYLAINEGELTKSRFMDIALVVVETAANLANESKIYAKEIVRGAINGSNDGITKAIEKYKDELKFAPDEICENLSLSIKELTKIEDDFVGILKSIANQNAEPASEIILEIVGDEYDSYSAKLKRISAEARAQIFEKIEELSQKSFKFGDVNLDEKIVNLKKEIVELEKKAGEKLAQMKNSQTFENAKEQAKKLGDRVYEAAKNLIDNTKKS
ncbi:hypothetical protein CIG2463D_0160 [Campylobacter iguaniorum]|uniref:Uncharacterized protein n=1 Tax=Campylobacter iguaniorum TaxID=1244531 RepID=A0A076FDX7_9BACT|nr:hypothetical protein [Campylobacter iguaniorum]AII14034.1 hypothetical protein CIG1485E_0157 [Campylobacter iguaniorum]ALV23772.1 hypothetical protein CIG2463D_0160 [Campylobacter iguaniorum]